jgi:hypothetical protein
MSVSGLTSFVDVVSVDLVPNDVAEILRFGGDEGNAAVCRVDGGSTAWRLDIEIDLEDSRVPDICVFWRLWLLGALQLLA